MAILHSATITPTKTELLTAWLPAQPWFPADAADAADDTALPVEPVRIGTFRFDDPAGQVGVETLILELPGATDLPLLQVPLTYRDAPLAGADAWLIGNMEHSVLGTRWVYDALGDPVYLRELASAALTGGTEAEQFHETPDGPVRIEGTAQVRGSGAPGTAVPDLDGLEITVVRVLDGTAGAAPDAATLTGTWAGQASPALLATVAAR
ncbi:MAG: hypothetical protein FWD85_03090 [Microbacteriaceae bacterium]|nr:hypothetical protein [Microbacteriaceae bacterium]MCL2794275.1 hypothetical protein [Microbacteriaceae bacterium]